MIKSDGSPTKIKALRVKGRGKRVRRVCTLLPAMIGCDSGGHIDALHEKEEKEKIRRNC